MVWRVPKWVDAGPKASGGCGRDARQDDRATGWICAVGKQCGIYLPDCSAYSVGGGRSFVWKLQSRDKHPANFRMEFAEARRESDVLSLHGAECDGSHREEGV